MAPPGGRGHTATTAAQIAVCSSASPGRSPDRGLSVSRLSRWSATTTTSSFSAACGSRAMGFLTAPNAWAGLSKGEAHQQADRPLADYAAPTYTKEML